MYVESNNIYFEDLIWLFSSNKQSRGIVRLNIAEGALLYKYCKKKKDSNILEIGRKYGGSTVIMASALDDGKLYSIDIKKQPGMVKTISSIRDKVQLINANSKTIEWHTPIGLLFIDGDHSYKGVKNDVDKFTPYVESGGYVIFHDVVGKKSILSPIVSGLVKQKYIKVDQADSMLVMQKNG